MENLRGKAAPAPNSIMLSHRNRAAKQGVSNQSNRIPSVSTRVQLSIHQGTAQYPVGLSRTLTKKQRMNERILLLSPPHTPDLSFPTAVKGLVTLRTYRQICIEIVLSVKQGFLVYGAVECQACHDSCFYTSPVENLRKQDTRFCSDTQYATNASHILPYMKYVFSVACLQTPQHFFP